MCTRPFLSYGPGNEANQVSAVSSCVYSRARAKPYSLDTTRVPHLRLCHSDKCPYAKEASIIIYMYLCGDLHVSSQLIMIVACMYMADMLEERLFLCLHVYVYTECIATYSRTLHGSIAA